MGRILYCLKVSLRDLFRLYNSEKTKEDADYHTSKTATAILRKAENAGRGFTLIELLLAISITSIIAGIIFYTFSTITKSVDRYKTVAQEYHAARLVLMKLSDDLSGTIFFSEPPGKADTFFFVGENNSYDGYPSDRVSFTTTASSFGNRGGTASDISEVEYFIEPDANFKNKVLYKRYDTVIDEFFEEDAMEILDNITGIDYIYFDEFGDEREEWNSKEQDEKERKLPKAVKITLIFGNDQTKTRKYSTVVAISLDI